VDRSQPWSAAEVLARVLAAWQQKFAGRELFRVAAGPGWLRLHLAGDDRDALLLTNFPGARLVFGHRGPLSAAMTAALPASRGHPLTALLTGGRLLGCGLLPSDRVAAFHLAAADGRELVLLHQMFGAQGNTTLLDRRRTLLWSVHRPPHPALTDWPPAAARAPAGSDAPPAEYDALALAHLAGTLAGQAGSANSSALARRSRAVERLVANLARDLARADQGELYRRKAEALAANLHRLRQGTNEVVLADLRDGTPLTIALDPARSPAHNLEAWFKQAHKADKGLAIIRHRLDEARAEQEELADAAAALAAVTGTDLSPDQRLAAQQAWRAAHGHRLGSFGGQPSGSTDRRKAEQPVARPFRRYLIDGTWEVWVGRNNRENDELTHRAAHARDIWLHAQGVSGSHVILRTGGHPERVTADVLAKAAALAALHSKARHSQLVPVIHTERRYVRRPRKAPPGTAVCLRDQSVFVEPGIRAGVETR
jgi:predicted ribosome quality control (RQC) complex YloA/Tae2 family protein